jgi:DMSO/TMAO reductase YedYZ molybdopterin-dependent catalytic subunit
MFVVGRYEPQKVLLYIGVRFRDITRFEMRYLITTALLCSSLSLLAQHEVPPTSGFKIKGAVKRELTIDIGRLAQYRQDSIGDVIVRNKKGEQKSVARQLKGVLLKTLLDSAGADIDKPKEYGELYVVLTASDGYKNVYSWNELFNTEVGNHVYLITEMNGRPIAEMPDRILVMSLYDTNSGNRHFKGLVKIEVKKI